jgi:hypothetical protein
MGKQTPEAGGEKPQNHGLSNFTALPEQRGVGPRAKKPEETQQQTSDPELEAFRQLQKEPRGSTIFVDPLRVPRPLPQNPGEQRGGAAPSQPTPVERQENMIRSLEG